MSRSRLSLELWGSHTLSPLSKTPSAPAETVPKAGGGGRLLPSIPVPVPIDAALNQAVLKISPSTFMHCYPLRDCGSRGFLSPHPLLDGVLCADVATGGACKRDSRPQRFLQSLLFLNFALLQP